MAGANVVNKIHVHFKTDILSQLFLVLCFAEVFLLLLDVCFCCWLGDVDKK